MKHENLIRDFTYRICSNLETIRSLHEANPKLKLL